MHFTLCTFKLGWEPPKQRGALFYTYDAALRNTNANHYMHSKPKPHRGHTITWRSSLRFLISLEREKQHHKRHMVRMKTTPRQAEVRPLKWVVYITRNPVNFVIQQRRDLFLLDKQETRSNKQQLISGMSICRPRHL